MGLNPVPLMKFVFVIVSLARNLSENVVGSSRKVFDVIWLNDVLICLKKETSSKHLFLYSIPAHICLICSKKLYSVLGTWQRLIHVKLLRMSDCLH